MLVVGICGATAVVFAAGLFAGVRRWADHVAAGVGSVTERVHRLRRRAGVITIVAVVVGAGIGGVSIAAGAQKVHGVRDHSHVAVSATVALISYLLPILAVARALRVPYARLRDVPVRVPGGLRRTAVSMATLGFIAACVVVGELLAPQDRAGRVFTIAGSYAVGIVGLFALAPLTIRATGLRPLPADLDARLRALAADMGVRVRGVGVIPSRRQRVANAVQVGFVPGFQYVLLTEYLVESMSDDEIDAVAAHELGHLRGRHVAVRLGVVLLIWAAVEALLALGSGPAPWGLGATGFGVGLIVTQWTLALRLERRADAAAERQIGGAHLADALTSLGELNHVPQHTGRFWNMTHAHPGLADRIATLRADDDAPDRARGGGHTASRPARDVGAASSSR